MGLVLIFLVFLLLKVVSIIPTDYARYTNVIEALVLGIILYIVLRIILRIIASILDKNMEKKYSRPLLFLISIIGYFVILLAILAVMGVNLSSIILGSAFAGAIVGLAAQQILSNFFSGILLIWSHPFSAGDYIEFNSWQYSYFLPSYPPKYLSRDEFRWKISGKVEDISMNFTTVIEENGLVTKIPNSVVIQGIISANPHRKKIQIRLEIPKIKDFTSFKESLGKIMEGVKEIENYKAYIEEIAKDSYLVLVTADSKEDNVEYVRGKIMELLLPITK
ncbi:MAG: mechanosensitive ion channel family protein [Thermoproteota archaeon]